MAMEAMAFVPPPIRLVVVGDGSQREALTRRAAALGLARVLREQRRFDLAERTLVPEQGRLSAVHLQPDPAALAQARISLAPERVEWWNDRLMRVRNLLESGALS